MTHSHTIPCGIRCDLLVVTVFIILYQFSIADGWLASSSCRFNGPNVLPPSSSTSAAIAVSVSSRSCNSPQRWKYQQRHLSTSLDDGGTPPSPTSTTGGGSSDGIGTEIDPLDSPTYNDIDWAGLDPLNDMSFEEYESYLQSAPPEEVEWDETIPTLNHLYLVGRIGSTPVVKYFGPENRTVVTTSLAVPRYYAYIERQDQKIEYGKEETEWYKLEMWNNVADFAAKFADKGTRVGIMGSLDTDFFRRRDNDLGRIPKVVVQDLDVLESRSESESRKVNKRGRSFFTGDDDDDNDNDDDRDTYNPSLGKAGGFFDPS